MDALMKVIVIVVYNRCNRLTIKSFPFVDFTSGEENGELVECFQDQPSIFSRTQTPHTSLPALINLTAGPGYTVNNDNTLIASTVSPNDEGAYSCQSQSGGIVQTISPCVLVSGEFIFIYTSVHLVNV